MQKHNQPAEISGAVVRAKGREIGVGGESCVKNGKRLHSDYGKNCQPSSVNSRGLL